MLNSLIEFSLKNRFVILLTRSATKKTDRWEIGPSTLQLYDFAAKKVTRTIDWPQGPHGALTLVGPACLKTTSGGGTSTTTLGVQVGAGELQAGVGSSLRCSAEPAAGATSPRMPAASQRRGDIGGPSGGGHGAGQR